jgi:hypothetical protein
MRVSASRRFWRTPSRLACNWLGDFTATGVSRGYSSSLELATMTGSVASGYTATLTVAVQASIDDIGVGLAR